MGKGAGQSSRMRVAQGDLNNEQNASKSFEK
jgi:hypothetical protein